MAKKSMKGFPDRSVTLTPTALERLELRGKRVAVVGGTGGLGQALAKAMAQRGAAVTVVGRTFRDQGTAGLDFFEADLASMKEARRVGRELPVEGLDVVVLTTGIFAAPQREVTTEGVERDLAVSYLSRVAILEALVPRLHGERRTRVFVMGFPGAGELGNPEDLNADASYDALKQHMTTVAGNEALVLDLAKRHPALGVFGLNPGLIKTNIRSNFLGDGSFKHRAAEFLIGLFMPSPEQYARTVVPVLFAPELETRSGLLFGAKGTAILPTEGLPERVEAYRTASAQLLRRVAG
jgi:NAD(P)-dependent dehydrogenase (short-subunit alcohol dehydrogenase family)